MVVFIVGRGREIRTPINGFGDRYSTLKLFPLVGALRATPIQH